MDNMMEMMEKYQLHLEDLVAERTEQLIGEKKKTEGLLHRMLPRLEMVSDCVTSPSIIQTEC